MTDVRYSVPGVPPVAANGITAFTPHFNRHAASSAQAYKAVVRGYPGTRAIPVDPFVQGVPPSPDPGDMASMGTARSSDAPNAIYPNQYYNALILETPGGTAPQPAIYQPQFPGRTTLIPIPAEDGRGTYQARSARLSRRAVLNRIAQIPVFPRLYRAPDGSVNQ